MSTVSAPHRRPALIAGLAAWVICILRKVAADWRKGREAMLDPETGLRDDQVI